jgi:uncharacterized protein YdaU (DUF1376 family)
VSIPAAMPLFCDAYLAETQGMTLEEQGAYQKLMICAWLTPACELPADDRRICMMLGIGGGKWAKLMPVVMAGWSRTSTGWHLPRLRKERKFIEEKRQKNTAAAVARWNGKSLETNKADHANAHADAHADAMPLSPQPLKKKDNIQPTTTPQTPRAAVHAPAENADQFEEVCQLAGVAPSEARVDEERRIFQGWLSKWPGLNFERDIAEVITAEKARKPGPSSSLKRFSAAILDRKANALAAQRSAAKFDHSSETEDARRWVERDVRSWIDPAKLSVSNDTMTLAVQSAFTVDYITTTFSGALERAARQCGLKHVRVEVRAAA